MGRPVVLSNGQMMVGLNEHGLVHDFYYPYVGLENLTTARSVHHKIGVWVDGSFSWVDDGTWQISVDFESSALVSDIRMYSERLEVELVFRDFVDHEFNAFIRRATVVSHRKKKSDIRVFMHQVFQISNSGRADTAMYVPDANYVLDYKGRNALLISGSSSGGSSFDQYAVGSYGIEGKAGTYLDAEDGELSGNPIEHGGVDSVVRFRFSINGGESDTFDYYIIAAASQYECEQAQEEIKRTSVEHREELTRDYWKNWLHVGHKHLRKVDERHQELTKKSLLIIKAHTDRRGATLASGDSSIFNYGRDYYCYFWPRDGAYAMWPLIRLGYTEEPKKYFEFCRDTLHRDGYMMHKYQPDRAIGSTWHPLVHGQRKELAIQEDETASVICMLGDYHTESKDTDFVQSMYSTLIQPAANFMSKYIDPETNLPHASYDLWEERFLTSTYTVAVTEHALRTAARFADMFDYPDDAVSWLQAADGIKKAFELLFNPDTHYYRKGFLLQSDGSLEFNETLDASTFYASFMFGSQRTDKAKIQSTLEAVLQQLQTPKLGVGIIRYPNDYYMKRPNYTGNPWFICTLWVAQYYVQEEQPEKAHEILDWIDKYVMDSGVASEQIDPDSGKPVGVAPLVWSHAEYINTILDLIEE